MRAEELYVNRRLKSKGVRDWYGMQQVRWHAKWRQIRLWIQWSRRGPEIRGRSGSDALVGCDVEVEEA